MSLLSRILVLLASVIVVFTVGLLEEALFGLLNVSSLFIIFIMVGVVAPPLNASRVTRLLWIMTLSVWLFQEFGFALNGGNALVSVDSTFTLWVTEYLFGINRNNVLYFYYPRLWWLLVPMVYVSIGRTLTIYRHHSRALKSLAMISVTGSIAYLLPYVLAARLAIYPLLGCLSLGGCGPTGSVRMLGSVNAGIVSFVLMSMTAIIGKRYLKRVVSSGAQPPVGQPHIQSGG